MYTRVKTFLVSGLMVNTTINTFLGYGINILVLEKYGYHQAILINTVISLIVSISYIRISDYYRADWLGIERAKSGTLIIVQKKNWAIRCIERYRTLSQTTIVILGFAWRDPIVTTLYFRTGNHLYDGLRGSMTKAILVASALVTNGIWTSVLYTGQSVPTIIWHFFKNLF